MLGKRIIPCLLLNQGKLVKTVQFDNPRHIGEPIYAIKIFNDYEADEIILVDICSSRSPNKEKKPISFDLISKISDESCMPITYGGGISSVDEALRLFRAGVEKVCLNTEAFSNPALITHLSKEFGRQSIVVSIDIRKTSERYSVFKNCGSIDTGLDPFIAASLMEDAGAGEILLNNIDFDGMMQGYDIPLIKKVVSSAHIPVIALGGAGKIDDFRSALWDGGVSAAAAGSMFVYFGKKKGILINYFSKEEINTIIKSP